MAQYPTTVVNFTAFIDGTSLAGRVTKGVVPNLTLATEEHSAGGMAGTVDVFTGALEKLEAELEMAGLSPDFMAGLGRTDFPLTLRGSISDGTAPNSAIYQMRGLFRSLETGDFERGNKGMQKIGVTLTYLKVTIAGRELAEADVLGSRLIIDGRDLMADHRAALGL